MSEKTEGGRGIVLTDGLLLLFIALKLMGYTDWSWVWVLAPLWMPFTLVLLVGFAAIAIGHKK